MKNKFIQNNMIGNLPIFFNFIIYVKNNKKIKLINTSVYYTELRITKDCFFPDQPRIFY